MGSEGCLMGLIMTCLFFLAKAPISTMCGSQGMVAVAGSSLTRQTGSHVPVRNVHSWNLMAQFIAWVERIRMAPLSCSMTFGAPRTVTNGIRYLTLHGAVLLRLRLVVRTTCCCCLETESYGHSAETRRRVNREDRTTQYGPSHHDRFIVSDFLRKYWY